MDQLWDLLFNFGPFLDQFSKDFGGWIYVILFAIIFCETGLVVTPILPGDSLLFAVGMIAARPDSGLNLWILYAVLLPAAILGDTVNYHIGKFVGPKVFSFNFRWLNHRHLEYTQRFFEKHGGKTIILARFLPIVRTFAPFVAGVGTMNYRRFLAYNVIGAIIWVVGIVTAGYLLGDYVGEENFELAIYVIVALSLLPGTITYLRHRYAKAEVDEKVRESA
ncbi:MAG TPA: VTT domain-containing protein [Pirellulaceae bacterium]|nr:VTT domain-containing protein [Pirellulaceae bacterium]